MRKTLLSLLLVAMSVVACKEEVNQEEVVSNAARQYYTYLLQGDYESFVDGCYQQDSIRPSYRAELVDNAKMFIGQQKDEHKGIRSVDVLSAKIDTLANTADVFLSLSYGDGTAEQVLLPMVKKDELWYMR